MSNITYAQIKENNEVNTYIRNANEVLGVLGYTDHSFAHVMKVSETAAEVLQQFGFAEREIELAQIAAYMHDIGNVINRVDHAQTGAIMIFQILSKIGMDPEEISKIVSAVGNHDEGAGIAISPISAALILADKTDVRRSRVRNKDFATFDIHDRVNYAVEYSKVHIHIEQRSIILDLTIDTTICSVMEYFEIFLTRMMMCRRAANFLSAKFGLMVNGSKLL